MNPRSNFNITKLLFTPTGTYNDQFLRPFYLGDNVDLQTMSILQEVTQGGRKINPGVLSPYSGQLLKPSADLTHQIQIANGYGEQRLRFMMEVESVAMGANLISYVTGWTDYPGYHRVDSQKIVIDPNMKLYFNNTVTLQHSNYGDAAGAVRSNVIDTSHLLFGKYNPSFNTDQSQVAMTTRPEDIFSIMEVSMQSGGQQYSDGRLLFADLLPKKSRRSNELTNNYLSTVLSNYRDSVTNAAGGMATAQDAMSFAIGNVAESVINEDPLFHAICRTLSFGEDGSITYGALCTVSPGLDYVTGVAGGESKYVQALHQRGAGTANLNSATPECLAATTVAREVPAIMSDLMLTGLMFTATNDTYGGAYEVEIAPNYLSFAKMDMTRYIEMFKQRLIGTVLQGLSNNRMTKFNMSVQVDMFGEIYVNISLNGGPITPHCFTAFDDASKAPVMSYNQDAVFALVNDFDTIANNLDIKHTVTAGMAQQPQHHQHAPNNIIVPQSGGNIHNPWEGQL